MMRSALLLLLMAVTLATVGCSRTEPSQTLVIGICDPLCKETASQCVAGSAVRGYDGVISALRGEISPNQVRFDVRYYRSDEQLADALRSGSVDAAIGKTWTVLSAEHAGKRKYERLADLVGENGTSMLTGVFIVRADSGLKSLADLDGKRIAFGGPAGYEKSYEAKRELLEASVKPGATEERDACIDVAAAVYEKKVDAGVVSDYVVDFAGLELVGKPGTFRELGRTKGIPFLTFAVATDVDAKLRKQLKEALLRIAGERVPAGLAAKGFIAAQDWRPPELEKP